MINLVVITTTQSLHLANWASYPQAERTSDTRCHFLLTTKSKKIFIEWIWLGKILANGVQFAKFAKVFPRQNFALYGIAAASTMHSIHPRRLVSNVQLVGLHRLCWHNFGHNGH